MLYVKSGLIIRLIILLFSTISVLGCANGIPSAEDAENGVICWEGSANGSLIGVSTQGRTNGVKLDADVDVTDISAEDWIALYDAFCGD